MNEYWVKSTDGILFRLNKRDKEIGTLTYSDGFYSASITMADGKVFQFESTGFSLWRNLSLKKEDEVILKFRFHWTKILVIKSFFGTQRDYLFTYEGILNPRHVLIDRAEKEILIIRHNTVSEPFSFNFNITKTDSFIDFEGSEVLLLAAIHFVRYCESVY